MAIEYFGGALVEGLGGALYEGASSVVDYLIERRNVKHLNKAVADAYREGLQVASDEWKKVLVKEVERRNSYSDTIMLKDRQIDESDAKCARLERELILEKREKIIHDCQRFGYMRVIGMLKAFIDFQETQEDTFGRKLNMAYYYHSNGAVVPVYEHRSGVRLKKTDLPDIDDMLHKRFYEEEPKFIEPVDGYIYLSVYEEMFLRGFWNRASLLWNEAVERNDELAMKAMVSISSLREQTFKQIYNDAVDLDREEKEGRKSVMEKYRPRWGEVFDHTQDYIKKNGIAKNDWLAKEEKFYWYMDKVRKDFDKECEDFKKKTGKSKMWFV
ncbi:hypothetical protein NQF86_03305 [Bombella sp. TMW 2.2543]|uniref:Uncharacterized protein n=1 Tax=Bombella pluederhausensis TaxID=2967336 RepID=A0ABT3WHJ6_9PROT|nr:hypothetical protein [Bombella pluederhausensis]MCX5617700.1 hypothetical protein [Bombella pluederhausensis]